MAKHELKWDNFSNPYLGLTDKPCTVKKVSERLKVRFPIPIKICAWSGASQRCQTCTFYNFLQGGAKFDSKCDEIRTSGNPRGPLEGGHLKGLEGHFNLRIGRSAVKR